MPDYLVLFSARPTISLSVKNLLSHLKIKEDLDSNYEEHQFVITRDSFKACFFYLESNSSASAQRLPPKRVYYVK